MYYVFTMIWLVLHCFIFLIIFLFNCVATINRDAFLKIVRSFPRPPSSSPPRRVCVEAAVYYNNNSLPIKRKLLFLRPSPFLTASPPISKDFHTLFYIRTRRPRPSY